MTIVTVKTYFCELEIERQLLQTLVWQLRPYNDSALVIDTDDNYTPTNLARALPYDYLANRSKKLL